MNPVAAHKNGFWRWKLRAKGERQARIGAGSDRVRCDSVSDVSAERCLVLSRGATDFAVEAATLRRVSGREFTGASPTAMGGEGVDFGIDGAVTRIGYSETDFIHKGAILP